MFGKNSLLILASRKQLAITELSTWKHGATPQETIPIPQVINMGDKKALGYRKYGEEWGWGLRVDRDHLEKGRGGIKGWGCREENMFSRVQLFATPWTIAHQAPLSMEFSRQEYWSG